MLLSAPAQGKDSSPIHGSSTRRGRHRCGHDGQRKCVAHMPTAATTTEDSRSKFGRKLPTRLHDEAIFYLFLNETKVHSALKAMRTTIRELDFRHQTQLSLVDIARRVNSLLRGWIEYYGRY